MSTGEYMVQFIQLFCLTFIIGGMWVIAYGMGHRCRYTINAGSGVAGMGALIFLLLVIHQIYYPVGH